MIDHNWKDINRAYRDVHVLRVYCSDIMDCNPELAIVGRELALAKTKLDEAMLWLGEAMREYDSHTNTFNGAMEVGDA